MQWFKSVFLILIFPKDCLAFEHLFNDTVYEFISPDSEARVIRTNRWQQNKTYTYIAANHLAAVFVPEYRSSDAQAGHSLLLTFEGRNNEATFNGSQVAKGFFYDFRLADWTTMETYTDLTVYNNGNSFELDFTTDPHAICHSTIETSFDLVGWGIKSIVLLKGTLSFRFNEFAQAFSNDLQTKRGLVVKDANLEKAGMNWRVINAKQNTESSNYYDSTTLESWIQYNFTWRENSNPDAYLSLTSANMALHRIFGPHNSTPVVTNMDLGCSLYGIAIIEYTMEVVPAPSTTTTTTTIATTTTLKEIGFWESLLGK